MAVALLLSQLRYPRVDCPPAPAQKTSVTSQVFRAPMSPLATTSRLLKITVRFGHLVVAWPRCRKRKATAARVVCGRGKPSTGERKLVRRVRRTTDKQRREAAHSSG